MLGTTATVHIKIDSRSFWVAVLTVSTPAYSERFRDAIRTLV
jgi:hypothetical protein